MRPLFDSIDVLSFMKQRNVVFVVACSFMLVLLFDADHVFAQEAGLRIVPASIEKKADPGETITETLIITNVSEAEDQYFLYKRDIKGVEAGGVPIFAEDNLETTGYEISGWVELQEEPLTIASGESVEFPLVINVPENASPGSHFGGVFVSKEPPRLREIGAGVGYEVAAIVSIRISGDIIDNARIRSFSTDRLFYSSKNVDFFAKVENQGNILIRPRGPLTISSMFGGDPIVFIVNDSRAGVFPGTVRDLEFKWSEEGIGFGRYEAILALAYDGEKGRRTIDASLVFWVFPLKIVIPLVMGILVLLLGSYFLMKLHVNRVVSRAAGRRIVSRHHRKQVGISRFAFVFVTLMTVLVLFLIILLIFFA